MAAEAVRGRTFTDDVINSLITNQDLQEYLKGLRMVTIDEYKKIIDQELKMKFIIFVALHPKKNDTISEEDISKLIDDFVASNDRSDQSDNVKVIVLDLYRTDKEFQKAVNDAYSNIRSQGGGMQRRPNVSRMTVEQMRQELRSAGGSGYSRATRADLEGMVRASRRKR